MDSEYLPIDRYPMAIAARQQTLLKIDQDCRSLQATLDQRTAEIEEMVAFDKTLTNDAKRRSLKTQLLAEPAHQELLHRLQSMQDARVSTEIELTLLTNQFSVLKLQARQAIARLEVFA